MYYFLYFLSATLSCRRQNVGDTVGKCENAVSVASVMVDGRRLTVCGNVGKGSPRGPSMPLGRTVNQTNIRSIMKMCCNHIGINSLAHECKKTLCRPGLRSWTPLGKLTSYGVPPEPRAGENVLAAPYPTTSRPLSTLLASPVLSPTPKLVPTPLGSRLASCAPSAPALGSGWRRRGSITVCLV